MSKRMLLKAVATHWIELSLGIGVLALGIKVIETPVLDSWKYGKIGFGDYNYVVGAIIAVLGVASLGLVLRRIYVEYRSGLKGPKRKGVNS